VVRNRQNAPILELDHVVIVFAPGDDLHPLSEVVLPLADRKYPALYPVRQDIVE
jgi:hypothetical protein